MQEPKVSTAGRALAEAPSPEPALRRRRSGLPVRLGAPLLIGLGLTVGLGIGTAQASPVPVPEVAPAGPTTTLPSDEVPVPDSSPSTTTPTASTTPTTAPPTSATATTAVVIADVATGAPPLVPQLASQGAAPGLATTSFVRPTRAELPVTGGREPALAALAMAVVAAGAVLIRLARRRQPECDRRVNHFSRWWGRPGGEE